MTNYFGRSEADRALTAPTRSAGGRPTPIIPGVGTGEGPMGTVIEMKRRGALLCKPRGPEKDLSISKIGRKGELK